MNQTQKDAIITLAKQLSATNMQLNNIRESIEKESDGSIDTEHRTSCISVSESHIKEAVRFLKQSLD